MRNTFFSIVLSLLCLTPSLHAFEGFHDDGRTLPKEVKEWAPRVFLIFNEVKRQPVGTAFLVHNDKKFAHFITAKHVAVNCKSLQTCSIRRDQAWERVNDGKPFVSPINLKPVAIGLFDPNSESWMKSGDAMDLAYFKAESDGLRTKANIKDLGMNYLSALPTSSYVQLPHYVIGYPYLGRRPSLKTRPATAVIALRWSEGRHVMKVPSGKRFLLHTDADSLSGNSGGPVIDAGGNLIGVLFGGPAALEYRDDYSYVVPLDYVKSMLGYVLRRSDGINWVPAN